MRSFDRQRRPCSGFSYLWLLLTIALLELGLVAAIEVDSTLARRDREKALLEIGRQFQDAIGSYYEELKVGGRNEYPASLEALLQDDRFPGTHRHLRKIFIDPLTGTTRWGLVKLGDRIVGVYSRAAGVPIKQGNFEPGLEHFENAKSYANWMFTYPPDMMVRDAETTRASP